MWKAYTVKNIKHYGKIKFYLKNCRKIYFHGSEDNIFKIPVSPKLNYKVNSIPIIISAGFYKNLQGNSKHYMEMQWSKIAKNCYS